MTLSKYYVEGQIALWSELMGHKGSKCLESVHLFVFSSFFFFDVSSSLDWNNN